MTTTTRIARDSDGEGVSRRGLIERAALLGAAMPALGALFVASKRNVAAEGEEAPRMFTREFRLPSIPTYDEGTVLYLTRRFIASDAPIPEERYQGVALYFVAAAADDGYLDLTHAADSTGTVTVHSMNGDNHDIPVGTVAKLYAGDAALTVSATYGIVCETFEGATLLMAGFDAGGGCAGRPCPGSP